MATEYNVVAKLDPSGVTTGKNQVKQDLKAIQAEAGATKTAINNAFDSASFDRSIGGLTKRIDALDKTMGSLVDQAAQITASNATLAGSMDRLATSVGKVGTASSNAGKGAQEGAKGQAAMDAATRRVLQAVDQEAAELARLNSLLLDAKKLHESGAITAEQFARVQKLVDDGLKKSTVSIGQQRAGYTQLGFQVQDITQTLALGINPLVVLAQQGGQTASALSLALGEAGTAGKVATFMAGPWGSLILAAVAVLGNLAYKAYESSNELEKMTKKLREDAREADLSRKAHDAYNKTLEGQIELQRKLNEELDKSIKTQRQNQQETLLSARTNLANLQSQRPGLVGKIATQQQTVNSYRDQILNPGVGTDPDAILGLTIAAGQAEKQLKALQEQLKATDAAIAGGYRAVNEAQQPLLQSEVEASLDKKAAAALRYTKELGRLNVQLAIGANRSRAINEAQSDGTFKRVQISGISADTYKRELARITTQKEAAEKAAAAAERAANASDGVARFKTRQQAIGIAGRELQQGGLRVSENQQFGGVTGGHANNSAHGQYAIDVNSGSGVTEANAPDLRAKFDQLARRYQARGYKVLWNGQVYNPFGSGPSGPIRGSDKHTDHMHLEAPQAIVGKPTNASTEAQNRQDDQAAARKDEQARDFVAGVVTQAASRGAVGQADTLQAQIDRTLAEFQTRFDRAANDNEKGQITKALTDADARETAARFDEAYVKPLERLRALQGKTGLDREVLNAQLEETARLGRELTPVEAQQIENGIRQNDELQRQAQILAAIKQPVEDYKAQIASLSALLASGAISQTQFNARVADLGANARGLLADLPGSDPNTGQDYSTIAAQEDENARYAKELAAYEDNRAQLLQLGLDYNALVEAAERRHQDNLAKIRTAALSTHLNEAQSIADSLLSIAENSVGKQNAVYKGLFIASKAFAIADAAVQGGAALAKALNTPFPANLAAIATVAASLSTIVASIQAVKLNLADGGYVAGPGTSRSDSVPANLSNGEFVVNAASTTRNRALLEAINSGKSINSLARPVAANDTSGPKITIVRGPGVEVEENWISPTEVELIAKRVVNQQAAGVAARALDDPNSPLSKSMNRNTTANRQRT